MDDAIRGLERRVALAPDDAPARRKLVLSLLSVHHTAEAWRAAHAGRKGPAGARFAALSAAIFEGAQAPFTLEILAHPPELRSPTPIVRLLGAPNGHPTSIAVGRYQENELVLEYHLIARRSCRVGFEGGTSFVVEDLGSANGLFKDGHRIQRAPLEDGERFSPATPAIEIQLRHGWDGAPWPPLLRSLDPRLLEDPTGEPEEPPRLRTGGSVGGYPLERIVGRGGFSFVYATSPGPGDPTFPLCIKIGSPGGGGHAGVTRVLGDLATSSRGIRVDEQLGGGLSVDTLTGGFGTVSSESVRTILAAEYALLRAFDSDLLPRPVRQGEHGGLAYYVMERIEGATLRDALRAEQRSGVEVVPLGRFVGLLDDLIAISERVPGFFHGDVKPENIMVAPGRLRLIDPAFRDGPAGLVRTLTPAYNPLARTGPEADTLALATILFERHTRIQPFAPERLWPGVLGPRVGAVGVSAEEFLDLGRFVAWRRDDFARQLLEWIERPPGYREMRAALGRV